MAQLNIVNVVQPRIFDYNTNIPVILELKEIPLRNLLVHLQVNGAEGVYGGFYWESPIPLQRIQDRMVSFFPPMYTANIFCDQLLEIPCILWLTYEGMQQASNIVRIAYELDE